MQSERQNELQKLWKRSLSFIDAPSGRVYFQGGEFVDHEKFRIIPIPSSFSDFVVSFAITAWNPMGNEVAKEVNILANQQLEADLRSNPANFPVSPIHVWSSGSEDPETGWGEPGFNVLFPTNTQEIEAAMIRLGKKYRQAALYRYVLDRVRGVVVQSVVPCADRGMEGLSSEVSLAFLAPR